MFARHPEMAKRWADHTDNIKSLPEKAETKAKEACSMTLEEKVIEAFQLVSAALERTQTEKAAAQREKVASASAISSLVKEAADALAANGCIQQDEIGRAVNALANHEKALRILIKTAAFHTQEAEPAAASLGRPTGQDGKTSKEGNTQSRRSRDEQRESDRIFLQRLGLPHLINND
jgi:hypothetical protein